MGALAPLPSWVPEDDILLKNAVEAGASLESLAKGAVRFSRRYTIKEVQDRWYSLLYDPIVSAEACARMFEFEQTNPSKNMRKNNGSSRKRKSVRSCYYALRKRIRSEPFDPTSSHFLVAPGHSTFGDENCMLEGPMANHFELRESDVEIVKQVFPQIMIEDPTPCVDASASQKIHKESIGPSFSNFPAEQNNLPSIDERNLCPGAKASSVVKNNHVSGAICSEIEHGNALNSSTMEPLHAFGCSSPLPAMPIWNTVEEIPMPAMPLDMTLEDMKGSVANNENFLVELTKTLLDGDEMPFMDVHAKDALDKSYYDGLSSLLNLSDDANHSDLPNPTEEPTLANPVAGFSNPQSSCSVDVTRNREMESSKIRGELPVASISGLKLPEMADGDCCCVLNTEDPDIPCNDDFIPKKSASAPSRAQRKVGNNAFTASGNDFSVNHRTVERASGSIQREPGQTHVPSQKLGSQISSKLYCDQPVASYNIKNEPSEVKSLHNAFKSRDVAADIPYRVGPNVSTGCLTTSTMKDEKEGRIRGTIPDHQASDAEVGVVDLASTEQLLDFAESEGIESDDDVPYFSDIEAMILDLDLDPDDEDINAHTRVSRYQNEEAKRAIVRLEQSAHAYMQRDIASHGAFAILYGRHSKHYIKKPEVLLGRRTEGFAVDIDLGREGFNKISRRQAIIKLEQDGHFLLKNLGKCVILVNNKEVSPGQSLRLCSNSLIEIRGMPFIFEANETRVKRYLEGLFRK